MTIPAPFESDQPHAASILQARYRERSERYFDAPWLHLTSSGGWSNAHYGGSLNKSTARKQRH